MRVVDVPAVSGAHWIKEAFVLFRAQPLAWISLTAAWVFISLILSAIPFVGGPAAVMFQPAFFAGFVLACRDQEMGKPVLTIHLLAGFRRSGRTLVQVGAITLFVETMIYLIFMSFGAFDSLLALDFQKLVREDISKALNDSFGTLLIINAVFIAIKGVLWFSAAIIAYQPMSALDAIRWSVFALIANPLPMLLMCVLLIVLFSVGIFPFLIGWIIVLPLYAIAHYTSFKSVFRADLPVETEEQR